MFLPCSKITPSLKRKVTATGRSWFLSRLTLPRSMEVDRAVTPGRILKITSGFGSNFVSLTSPVASSEFDGPITRQDAETKRNIHDFIASWKSKIWIWIRVISVLNSPTWTIRYRSVMTSFHHCKIKLKITNWQHVVPVIPMPAKLHLGPQENRIRLRYLKKQ